MSDIYEKLNTKDNADQIDDSNFEDNEQRKKTETLAEQFTYQSGSDDESGDEEEKSPQDDK